jgi:adenylate cyclase
MIAPERELSILRAVDRLADAAGTLDDLVERLGLWLRGELDAPEALITPLPLDAARPLPEGTSPEVASLLPSLAADPELSEREDGDVFVRALRPDGDLVGAVIVRKPGGVSEADKAALGAFEERADSALLHALEREQLRDRTLELETIYEIDHIRDQHLEFHEMLQAIMAKILQLVPADCALIALRELHAEDDDLQLYVRAREGERGTTARFVSEHRGQIERVVKEAFESREMVEHPIEDEDRDVVCMPLILDDEILGGFLLLAQPHRRFTERDRRLFAAVCSQADTAIFEDVAKQRIKDVFKRYVSKSVFSEMLRCDEDFLKGRRREITCFFSDLRGFTAVSEKLDVDVVVDMLNEHLEAMTDIVFDYGGTVDKFIGDCVMGFFGAPLYQPDHVLRALRCADAMRARHNEIAEAWESRGLPNVKIGIGMHTGEVFVGNIGGEKMASYTVIGDHVNLASRLEGQSGPDDIILSGATLQRAWDNVEVEPRGEIVVKGKTVPVQIYNLLRIKD